jgi:transcriptional regulator with XRE-family HTH domain
MKPTTYDFEIIKGVEILRIKKGVSQENIAKELGIAQSTYCRIVKGELAITAGQLKVISLLLGVDHLEFY